MNSRIILISPPEWLKCAPVGAARGALTMSARIDKAGNNLPTFDGMIMANGNIPIAYGFVYFPESGDDAPIPLAA